jgi:hypothetical protein
VAAPSVATRALPDPTPVGTAPSSPSEGVVDEGSSRPVVTLDPEAYAGQYRCRGETLWLHPSGVFAFRGATGTWLVSAPGVVRMYDHDGPLLAKAAIETHRSFCREAW